MTRSQIVRRLAPTALIALLGCGGEPEDSYPLVPVKGKVTRDGGFVGGASISFMPAPDNAYQTPGGATTDSSGMFTARFRNRDGLAVGHYKVLVVPDDTPDVEVDATLEEAFKDDPIMLREMKRAGGGGAKGASKRKAGPRRAEFEIDVPDGGLEHDFEMTKAGASAVEGDAR